MKKRDMLALESAYNNEVNNEKPVTLGSIQLRIQDHYQQLLDQSSDKDVTLEFIRKDLQRLVTKGTIGYDDQKDIYSALDHGDESFEHNI